MASVFIFLFCHSVGGGERENLCLNSGAAAFEAAVVI